MHWAACGSFTSTLNAVNVILTIAVRRVSYITAHARGLKGAISHCLPHIGRNECCDMLRHLKTRCWGYLQPPPCWEPLRLHSSTQNTAVLLTPSLLPALAAQSAAWCGHFLRVRPSQLSRKSAPSGVSSREPLETPCLGHAPCDCQLTCHSPIDPSPTLSFSTQQMRIACTHVAKLLACKCWA